MNSLRLLFAVCSLTLFFSCKKEEQVKPQDPPASATQSSLAFLDNAVSDVCSDSGFYIKGEFNGHKLCFASTAGEPGSYFVDTFSNAYFNYHYDDVKKDSTTDNLYLIRQNSNSSVMLAMYCGQTHIEKRTFPYTLPHPDLEHCEFTEFSLMNMNHDYSIGQNTPQDNYSFEGYTTIGMKLTFTKLTSDNIVEGIFSGTLRTNTGSVITVTNGAFRIKFVVSDQTIVSGQVVPSGLQQTILEVKQNR